MRAYGVRHADDLVHAGGHGQRHGGFARWQCLDDFFRALKAVFTGHQPIIAGHKTDIVHAQQRGFARLLGVLKGINLDNQRSTYPG